jgi:hypothetical protein
LLAERTVDHEFVHSLIALDDLNKAAIGARLNAVIWQPPQRFLRTDVCLIGQNLE